MTFKVAHGKDICILGSVINSLTMHEAIEQLDDVIQKDKKCQVTYLNADCLNKAFINTSYRQVIDESDFVFPDGIGVKIAAVLTGQVMNENINGTDMFPEICRLAQKRKYRLFFLGAKPGVVDVMQKKVEQRYPGIFIAGIHHGFFEKQETKSIIDHINGVKADILFVAMGAPHQEMWIRENYSRLNCSIMLGVGGLFDFNSERIKRAPVCLRRFGCEWVWRLLQEPRRMWRRYLIGNVLFLYRILRYGKNLPKASAE